MIKPISHHIKRRTLIDCSGWIFNSFAKSYAWSTIGNNSGSTTRISSSSFDLQFSPSSLEQKSFKSLLETKWQPTKLNKNRQTNKYWLVILENHSNSLKCIIKNKNSKNNNNWKFWDFFFNLTPVKDALLFFVGEEKEKTWLATLSKKNSSSNLNTFG